MKKVLLFSMIGLMTGAAAIAQKGDFIKSNKSVHIQAPQTVANKTTGDGDTYMLSNIITLDSVTYYSWNNTYGFVEGMSGYGYNGFAERYDFDNADSSMKVVGVMAIFHGTYVPSTTQTINIKVWSQSAPALVSSNFYFDGIPDQTLTTETVNISTLGIDPTQNFGDSIYYKTFTTPTAYLTDSFYIGYDLTYTPNALTGDTIGVYSTTDGSRTSAVGYISGSDTVMNVQNAFKYNGSWYDEYTYIGIRNDYALFPVVTIKYNPTAIKGVERNNFTLYGNYPNPATDATNIRFSLKTTDDITITVTDIAGRIISSTTEKGLAAGEHTSIINTSALSAGNYIYLIRSGNGGIASQFTVAK